MKPVFAAYAAGISFAVGLALAGMTHPSKIIGFLDVFGSWDPSLAFVMAGAVGVHFGLLRLILRRKAPLFRPQFVIPSRRDVDAPLLVGAALFGIGWGASGFCPGPAIVSVPGGGSAALTFTAAMFGGMILHEAYQRALTRRLPPTPVANDGGTSAPEPS